LPKNTAVAMMIFCGGSILATAPTCHNPLAGSTVLKSLLRKKPCTSAYYFSSAYDPFSKMRSLPLVAICKWKLLFLFLQR